jgi:hypothetical protein
VFVFRRPFRNLPVQLMLVASDWGAPRLDAGFFSRLPVAGRLGRKSQFFGTNSKIGAIVCPKSDGPDGGG